MAMIGRISQSIISSVIYLAEVFTASAFLEPLKSTGYVIIICNLSLCG